MRHLQALLLLPLLLAPPLSRCADGRPRITGISHVALWVKDLEASRAFYKGYLGFDEPYSLPNASGGIAIAWIKVNDRQSVELFPTGGLAPRNGDSLYHLALETDDAQAMLGYLASRGIHGPGGTPLPGTAKAGRIGNLNYFTEDPDGHIIEFTQYLDSGWTRRSAGKFLPQTRISTRIRHAGFVVRNLEASLHFYRDVLGFTEFWRGSSDGRTLSWVNLRIPDGDDYIELMLAARAPDARQLHILNHLCLEVADAAAAASQLSSRTLPAGCEATGALRTGTNRKRQLNAFDPDGTRVEMMEPVTVDAVPAPSSAAPPPAPWGG